MGTKEKVRGGRTSVTRQIKNDPIAEVSEEESFDETMDINLRSGFKVGYKGSRLFLTEGKHREKLPFLTPFNQKVPVNIVGKFIKEDDLTKVPLPVVLNEPISILQKTCEMMANVSLLE